MLVVSMCESKVSIKSNMKQHAYTCTRISGLQFFSLLCLQENVTLWQALHGKKNLKKRF